MKECHICNNRHNHVYCPLCGAFCYVLNGARKAINRHGVEVTSAIGRMAYVMRYAHKIRNNRPVGISIVRQHLVR